MKVLYITASCLTKNTSANMSHNAYVQGLLENGVELDIIMAKDSWGEADGFLHKYEGATYYEFSTESFIEKIRERFSHANTHRYTVSQGNMTSDMSGQTSTLQSKIRNYTKKLYYFLFPPDALYPLNAVWLKKSSAFKSKKKYDLVITNSTPDASHRLMYNLKKKGHLKYKRWIQIWEDPWSHDLLINNPAAEKEEEMLLEAADSILYVSPITLHYQKLFFPNCKTKMHFIPLPYLKLGNNCYTNKSKITFGYFGDYYTHIRNLLPFYKAVNMLGSNAYIYGDSNLILSSTENIKVSGRVTLDILEKIQNNTTVLVHLSNLRGGQIPGKIYHYSATSKPILFILDGTDEEKKILRSFFSKYNRYYFCNNTVEDISHAMRQIVAELDGYTSSPVEDFSPRNVVAALLKENE